MEGFLYVQLGRLPISVPALSETYYFFKKLKYSQCTVILHKLQVYNRVIYNF